ncbi:uncharacterized protein LOC133845442 isoform X2 [Drosophila sulfurigaster albostrigata]|nr:uncharacterized protein LOC133845442 isoform X2 [Drosophila sulfurigaster albostrigata]
MKIVNGKLLLQWIPLKLNPSIDDENECCRYELEKRMNEMETAGFSEDSSAGRHDQKNIERIMTRDLLMKINFAGSGTKKAFDKYIVWGVSN